MSLVLSGGYEDDVDNGDEFTYTGSGGRELKGKKGLNQRGVSIEGKGVGVLKDGSFLKDVGLPLNSVWGQTKGENAGG
jgi:hypothetical protein